MDKENAVYVRNADKSYGQKEVLSNFSMTVPKGSIYGLLGASGCGKTTLLSCIVGRKQFNSGELWVLGGKPGTPGSKVPGSKVGYMPQDVALVAEFTIRDAIFYFGRIFRMPDSLIQQRLNELTILLDLPPDHSYVGQCSGGQQRRISFAAALLHNPELLILDEPTVGLDPVLRDKIWNHLVELTEKNQVTIIITTHYIEETKQAHKIGLMREGRLLAEESPTKLLNMFGTETLEEVFLILSQKQASGQIDQFDKNISGGSSNDINGIYPVDSVANSINSVGVSFSHLVPEKKKIIKAPTKLFNGYRLKALFDKNWKQFHRNISGLMFMIIFPIFQMCAFLSAVGGDITNIDIAVINEENNFKPCTNQIINKTVFYNATSDICQFDHLGCRFLDAFDVPMMNHIYYNDLNSAIQDIKTGKVYGALYFQKNFSEASEEKIHNAREMSEEDLISTEIETYMDMSNRQIGTTLKFKLIDTSIDVQKKIASDCGFLKKSGDIPMNFMEYYFGDKNESYVVFMIPGALITMIFFLGTTNASTIIISDRLEGVWDRSIVAGVTSAEILLAHFVTQLFIIICQTALILIIPFVAYGYSPAGSMYTIILLIFLQGLCGIGYGFLVSVVCSDHNAANILSTGTFYPMILTCGLVWPIESMPTVLRWITLCMPFTIPILSVRNVLKKGWSLSNMYVWDAVGVEIAWCLVFGTLSAYQLRKGR